MRYILLLGLLPFVVEGQQILLDKPVRAGELILFPSVSDESDYYYLADKPRLAFHEDGRPQFSFLRYVKNEKTEGSENNAITESNTGGGIIHALVELSVSDEQLKIAKRALSSIDGDAKIIGPVVFKSGTVSLISAVVDDKGDMVDRIVGLGSAPILENQKSAVAVQLNKLGSKILWETFNTPTPDFTFNFEMEVEGYLSPKRVLIEADFDRIYKHKAFDAGVAANLGKALMSAEISTAFDELTDQGAIKVTQIGTDEDLEKLRETAYTQLISLMFDKVGGTGVPQMKDILPGSGQKSMLDRATTSLEKARKEASEENRRIEVLQQRYRAQQNRVRGGAQQRAQARLTASGRANPRSRATPAQLRRNRPSGGEQGDGSALSQEDIPKRVPMPTMSVAVSYRMKQIKHSGKYKIDLNKYTETTRSMPFAYNPGNVKGQCDPCFLEVNLDDDLMKQREINASLGGINSADFDYINFVNIVMKKKHQNGQETADEIKIDKSEFDQKGNFFKMLYGWKGDANRDQWLGYEYRTMWSYTGGITVETPWATTDFGSIALNPALVKKPVYVEVDEDFVIDENVRGIELNFYTTINGVESKKRISLKTDAKNNEFTNTVELLLPREVDDYEYEVVYYLKGRADLRSSKQSSNYGRID
ncbi:MAG: hypothetical protein AAGJ18_02475, partial [Bacteroidota bacterium]